MTRTPSLVLLTALLSPLPLTAQVPGDLTLTPMPMTVGVPLAVRHAGDGSNRLFVVDREGEILIFEPGVGQRATPFLDLTDEVDPFFEGGLLGLAFHPDFATNGFFFVSYTRTGDGGNPLESVIERYTVSAGDANIADPASAVEIFTRGQPAGNHNGGDLHFGPDGFLYLALGDGGYDFGTSQDIDDLLGKMIRIDPCDTTVCTNAYAVPADNPFVGVAGADEIWSLGFRNPYRWSFDRMTGDMLIADVGEDTREEVSFEAAGSAGGLNYGWPCREGLVPGPVACSGTFVDPILDYTHAGGNCSITGGYRYRGCIQGLRGTYVFADFCTAKVFFGTEDTPGSWSVTEWDDLGGSVFGFGEDESGELYLLQGGTVFRFESASSCSGDEVFTDGFESGDLSAWSSST